MTIELSGGNFQQEVLASAIPVLVDFWAPTCAPCRRLLPIVEQLAAEAGGRFKVGKINVWEQPDLTARYHISSLPTLLIFQGGEVVTKLVGYHDRAILLKALRQVGEPASASGIE
jgi:thioredoxin 1